MSLTSGTKLGHYQITDLLGKGGMGEVYRARDSKLGREVAIKALPAEFEKDSDRLARFEREARMLAALNHPNIAVIYGLEQSDATRFLVLELIEGDTLADRLKHGAIPVDEALKLALQIAEALEAAHEKGVIHRDLKPANIKITPDGKVKVLDFGLAKAYVGEASDMNLSNSPTISMAATRQGLILGTAGYMSPQQANGEVVDKRTDIWSFGVVLFEMLTGKPLFTGKNVSYILADVLRAEPNWNSLPANLHPRVRMILERSLEKEAKNRLSGISDARVEIQKALANPNAESFTAGLVAPRKRSMSILPWVAAVVLAAVTGFTVWSLRPIELHPVSRWSYVLPEGTQFRKPGWAAVDISKDGSQIVYNALDGLYIRPIGQFEARKIQGTEGGMIASPTFSPDGQWVAFFFLDDQQIRKIAIAGGPAVPLAPIAGMPDSINWDTDDSILFTSEDGIWRVSASGGNPERIVSTKGGGYSSQLLPGANAILSDAPGPGGQVVIYSIQSGKSKLLFPGLRPRYLKTGHIVYLRDGALFAVAFDLDKLEVKGGHVSLAEGIQGNRNSAPQYSISQSGSLVYLTNPGLRDDASGILSWVDLNGVQTPLPVPPKRYRQPRLSPNGTRVAVYTETGDNKKEIWVYDLDGKSQIQKLAGEGNNSRPIWMPDSQRLTFTSDRKGAESIWRQPADGSKPAEPITEGDKALPQWPDAWTPDGNTLAFTKFKTGGEQSIWTLSPGAGSKPKFVAGGMDKEQAGGADFSPDGNWIAYRTNVTEPNHIQIQPFPTTGTLWDTAYAGGSYPMWSKDTSQLFYRLFYRRQTQSADVGKLAVVDVSFAGGSPHFTNERVLPIHFQVFFGNRDYDITKDGKRMIVIVPEGKAEAPRAPERPEINVVLNWVEELKSRVPSR
jgi:serine/threonine-protein kinase